MPTETVRLLPLIRAAIDETQRRIDAGADSRALRHVLALLWSAHDEVELVDKPAVRPVAVAPRVPPATTLAS